MWVNCELRFSIGAAKHGSNYPYILPKYITYRTHRQIYLGRRHRSKESFPDKVCSNAHMDIIQLGVRAHNWIVVSLP